MKSKPNELSVSSKHVFVNFIIFKVVYGKNEALLLQRRRAKALASMK